MSNENSGFAGLLGINDLAKAIATQDAGALSKPRSYTELTFPSAFVSGLFYEAGFCEADLTFRMVDLTPLEQEEAAELGGDSAPRISREMLFASFHQIGSWKPKKDRDRLELWWNSIGPKCTGLAQAAIVKTHSVEEKEMTMFLATATKGRG